MSKSGQRIIEGLREVTEGKVARVSMTWDAYTALLDRAEAAETALRDLNAAIDTYWNGTPRCRELEIKALCEAQARCRPILDPGRAALEQGS